MKITYFDLVNSALMVAAMICIFAAGAGLYGNPFSPVTVGLAVFVIAVASFVGGRLRDSAPSDYRKCAGTLAFFIGYL